jgi:phenylpropionate dioxygenase-like ring-hydroxylating dioxygenase large terminal subunit
MTDHDPSAWARRFTDPAFFTREQARLGTAWTLLGLTGDVRRDGDWFRATLGGRSVFVQRFGESLRAFENVCAHRFFPLRTEDRGNGPIRCGFHHWQYNKEGMAAGIPKCAEMFGGPPREVGARLAPVEVATCGALVFGRFPGGSGSQSLRDYLGVGYPILEAMTNVARIPDCRTLPAAANWKLGYHISLDDYHLVAVHPDTFGRGGYLNADAVRYYRFGVHSAYFYGGGPGALEEMAAACADGTYRPTAYRIFQIFPNLLLSHTPVPGGCYTIVQQYVPVAVDRTTLRTWAFPSPFPVGDGGLRHTLIHRLVGPWLPFIVPRYARKIGREDNAVCERLQTVAAQAPGHPRLARHEERIAWFEEAYDAWVNAEATGAATPP